MKKIVVFICFLFSSIIADIKKPIENKQISKNIKEDQINTNDSFYEHLKNIDIPNDFNLPEIILGKTNAPHTLIIYTSFSCPLCCKFHQNELPNLNEFVNKGILKIYFRNYLDDMAALESSILMRAFADKNHNKIDIYQKVYKKIYAEQASWLKSSNPREFLIKMFKDLGFSEKYIKECLNIKSKTYIRFAAGLMKEQQRAMHQWKIDSVPAFILDDEVYIGFISAKDISKKLHN